MIRTPMIRHPKNTLRIGLNLMRIRKERVSPVAEARRGAEDQNRVTTAAVPGMGKLAAGQAMWATGSRNIAGFRFYFA